MNHALGMNDRSELRHLETIILEEIENIPNITRARKKQFANSFQIYSRDLYLACFSEEHDCLSQWRGYADDGTGYNIGFDVACLPDCGIPPGSGPLPERCLFKIDYDDITARAQVIEILASYANSPNVDRIFGNGLNGDDIEKLTQLAFRYKNPAFVEEKEWRAVFWPNPISFMDGPEVDPLEEAKFGLISFFEHNFRAYMPKTKAIKRIILGPKNISHENFVKAFLEKHGYEKDVKVTRSAASYG